MYLIPELVRFYEATNGDNWTINSGWLVAPIEEWFGITLSEDGKRVTVINLGDNNGLPGNNLVGELIELKST